MPEADRFERKLPRHWRQPYRVARSGRDDFGVVVDCLMPAFRETLKQHATPEGILDVFAMLHEAVIATNGQQQSLVDWAKHMARFDESLEALEVEREGELCIRAFARAALCAYAKLREEGAGSIDPDHIRDVFAEAFGTLLLENQWLPKTREGLMEARMRNLDAQLGWEAELLKTIAPQIRALFKTLFATRRIPSRSPRRLTKPMEITRDSLSQPIDLSELDRD
jgi:hypothetical protein